MDGQEQEWEHHPYEPTGYGVLERLAIDDLALWQQDQHMALQDALDCRDLFPEKDDARERIWIYMMT